MGTAATAGVGLVKTGRLSWLVRRGRGLGVNGVEGSGWKGSAGLSSPLSSPSCRNSSSSGWWLSSFSVGAVVTKWTPCWGCSGVGAAVSSPSASSRPGACPPPIVGASEKSPEIIREVNVSPLPHNMAACPSASNRNIFLRQKAMGMGVEFT